MRTLTLVDSPHSFTKEDVSATQSALPRIEMFYSEQFMSCCFFSFSGVDTVELNCPTDSLEHLFLLSMDKLCC